MCVTATRRVRSVISASSAERSISSVSGSRLQVLSTIPRFSRARHGPMFEFVIEVGHDDLVAGLQPALHGPGQELAQHGGRGAEHDLLGPSRIEHQGDPVPGPRSVARRRAASAHRRRRSARWWSADSPAPDPRRFGARASRPHCRNRRSRPRVPGTGCGRNRDQGPWIVPSRWASVQEIARGKERRCSTQSSAEPRSAITISRSPPCPSAMTGMCHWSRR